MPLANFFKMNSGERLPVPLIIFVVNNGGKQVVLVAGVDVRHDHVPSDKPSAPFRCT